MYVKTQLNKRSNTVLKKKMPELNNTRNNPGTVQKLHSNAGHTSDQEAIEICNQFSGKSSLSYSKLYTKE